MEENKKKYLDIKPVTKGKRILLFLGDFFINFILSFVIFNVVITPLGKVMTNYEQKAETFERVEKQRIDLLYNNELIFYNDEVYKYEQSIYMKFTYDCFLSYYVLTEPVEFEVSNSRFGNNINNEVIKHYYVDLKNNEDKYHELFAKYNDKVGYFDIENNNYILKENYREQLVEYFNSKGEMSESGLELYERISSSIFFALFGEVLSNISLNPTLDFEILYNNLSSKGIKIQNYHINLLTISAFISYLLSTLIVFLLYPLATKTSRTPTMSIFKFDRINIYNFSTPKKVTNLILFIYAFVFNFPFIMFLPMTLVGFAGVFQFSALTSFSLVSFLLVILSMITLLFDSFSRSISDKFSKTVLISEADLFEIYKAKGYMK